MYPREALKWNETLLNKHLNKLKIFQNSQLGNYFFFSGTRCDDYTYKLITGLDRANSCHTHLTNAVREVGLTEDDVHDVWNLFMCTGFTRVTSIIHYYHTNM